MKNPVKIYVPQDTAAMSMGSNEIAKKINVLAKKQKKDIEIIRNGSWGMSWLEPLIEVQIGKKRIAYGPVAEDDVQNLFDSNFLNGSKHPLHLGETKNIPYLKNQQRWTFRKCGLINPLCIDSYIKNNGYKGLKKVLNNQTSFAIDELDKSGLRGRGGAGFPTGIKWKTVATAKGDQKYIACNADEGDSGTFSDRILMESDPFSLIEGMAIAGYSVGANKGYIYLRSEYPHACKILQETIKVAKDNNWLGKNIQGSGFNFDIDIHIGGGSYVCGEETAMLESLEGKAGIIRYKPPLPAIEGLFGKPTIVNNVVTLASIPDIIDQGGVAYAKHGMNRSKGTLAFQLSGNIKQGGLVELAFGVTLRELIDQWGGGTASGRPVHAVQVGGPLGAYFPDSLLDTPLDYEAFAEKEGMIGHGGIVVFDDSADMAAQAKFAMEFCSIESCGKCTPCRIGSTRGVEVINKIIDNNNREENIELLHDLCETMIDGSLCAMGGLTPFPVKSALEYFPEDFNSNK
ncbi:MAG: NADH-ubiquinone oxidoreductase-F iron-sulfur binding region domain-containing protein [Pseudomonadota bacterium]|nr:NADH-ubiquinone oxidoreductase-F iron-sulfur binding region domain-containing protein [Pseudomonadota bacterium]